MGRIGAVVVVVVLLVAGCQVVPTGPGAEEAEARLRQIASTTDEPVYWLGSEFHGWALDSAILADGSEAQRDTTLGHGDEMTVLYGAFCIDRSCGWRAEVGIQDVPIGSNVVGCARLAPMHGVPTVTLAGESVILFTGDLAIRVATSVDDLEVAKQGAAGLRRFGDAAPVGTLPPPPASKLKLIDKACGQRPGEHGPDLFEEPEPTATDFPDFTVPRLGGGQLRWAEYVGKPVVVVAGDITQVAPAVRRLASLTSGGTSPAVIGLAWDTLGDKEHPASSAEVERKAGRLPVPVGYPATYAAVWLSDTAATDPSEVGVIAFFGRGSGTPSSLLRTDASDAKIRRALEQLR